MIMDLLKMNIGDKVVLLNATIKTVKKRQEMGDELVQTCVLADQSGEILADVLLATTEYGKDNLIRGTAMKVLRGEIQHSVDGIKLFVSRYSVASVSEPTCSANNDQPDWDKIARGKTRCAIVCAYIQSGKLLNKNEIEDLIDYIFKGD